MRKRDAKFIEKFSKTSPLETLRNSIQVEENFIFEKEKSKAMKKGRITSASGMLASINEDDIIKPLGLGKGVTTRMSKRKLKVTETLV